MPLNSAFPALLFRDFRPPVLGGFSRHPEGSRGCPLSAPCAGAAVAAWTLPDFAHPRRLEGLQPQAGFIQLSAPVWCCIMSKNYFSESPGRSPDLLSRLRPQPVPLWASLNLLMQMYGELLTYPNVFASFFKQIFKLSFKTLKTKQLQTGKVLRKFAERRKRE